MIKVGSRVLALAVAMIGLAACQVKPAGQAMSGADVRAAFAGNTLHGTSVDGDFVIYVTPPGDTVHGMLWGGRHDQGTSTVSADGNFCITWHLTFDGKTMCYTVRSSAAGFDLLNREGIVFATVKTSAGNSDGL
jgi:hypothetical protein